MKIERDEFEVLIVDFEDESLASSATLFPSPKIEVSKDLKPEHQKTEIIMQVLSRIGRVRNIELDSSSKRALAVGLQWFFEDNEIELPF